MRLTFMAVSFAFATATTSFANTIQTFSPLAVGDYCKAKVAQGSVWGFYQSSGLNCYGSSGPSGQPLGRGDATAACIYLTGTERVVRATRAANDALTCEFLPLATGTLVPIFYVTHVVYPPPGDGSVVSYAQGTVFGSTTSTSKTWKTGVNVQAELGGKFLGFGSSLAISSGASWGNTSSRATDITATTRAGIAVPGQPDFVDHALQDFQNHGSDQIWFLVKPRINVTITPAWNGTPQLTAWGFASQNFDQYFVYVRELRDPSIMPANVKAYLDSQGLTANYYPQLLAADPLASGRYPGATMDPARFEYQGQFPYVPPARPEDKPTLQTYSVMTSTTNTNSTTREASYTVSVTATGSAGFLDWFTLSSNNSSFLTFTHSTSTQNTTGSSHEQAFTLSQPPYGYLGPTHVHVYLDKMWKSYVFTVDYF